MSRTRMARAPRPRASRGPLLLAALLLLGGAPGAAQAVDRFIRADSIHVGDGRTIEDGVVQVRDGRIVAVGAGLPIPAGAEVIDLSGHHLTPGLIDANSKVEPESLLRPMAKSPEEMVREMFGLPPEPVQHFHDPRVCPEYASHEEEVICPICGGESADPDHHGEVGVSGVSGPSAISEQSSEVIPQTAWLDAIDLDSPDFQRLLRDGVTTIYAAPDPSAVIGARGAILRTAGAERVLEREAAVKATIGSDPYRFGTFNRRPSIRSLTHFSRRPQSRMGVGWIFRKAFYDTLLRAEGGTPSGADTADPAAHAVLAEVLAGTVPLRVQARTSSDIESAYRLCGEFGVRFTLVDPVEGYRVLERIERDPVPIVFGPIYDDPNGLSARTSESSRSRLHTLRDLIATGAPVALSAQDLREEDGLGRQAMMAVRFGVDHAKALSLVTSAPARMLGLAAEVGTIAPGRRADLVAWPGVPFAATSAVQKVFVDGALAFDREEDE
ncbi:MAG: amidohydrolase family protein [Planctomycetota bacterium]